MIRHCQGDLLASGAEALVNPVNCVGVAGAGLAKAFRRAYEFQFERYKSACRVGWIKVGEIDAYQDEFGPTIINFPTKVHWKDKSRLSDIEAGLADLARWLTASGCRSIAVPALGCGLGGLDWRDVRPLIEAALGNIDGLEVMLYGPQEARP